MAEKYGEPKEGDATSRWDHLVEKVAVRLNERADFLVEKLLNRPVGSKKVKPEDRLQDYILIRENPEKLAQLYTEDAAKVGQGPALVRFLDYVEEMEKKLK